MKVSWQKGKRAATQRRRMASYIDGRGREDKRPCRLHNRIRGNCAPKRVARKVKKTTFFISVVLSILTPTKKSTEQLARWKEKKIELKRTRKLAHVRFKTSFIDENYLYSHSINGNSENRETHSKHGMLRTPYKMPYTVSQQKHEKNKARAPHRYRYFTAYLRFVWWVSWRSGKW